MQTIFLMAAFVAISAIFFALVKRFLPISDARIFGVDINHLFALVIGALVVMVATQRYSLLALPIYVLVGFVILREKSNKDF